MKPTNHLTLIQALEATKELLTTIGWCQGSMACDIRKQNVHSSSSKAFCYCLIGGLNKVCLDRYNPDQDNLQAAKEALQETLGITYSLMKWNDAVERKLSEVIHAIDQTISRLNKNISEKIS